MRLKLRKLVGLWLLAVIGACNEISSNDVDVLVSRLSPNLAIQDVSNLSMATIGYDITEQLEEPSATISYITRLYDAPEYCRDRANCVPENLPDILRPFRQTSTNGAFQARIAVFRVTVPEDFRLRYREETLFYFDMQQGVLVGWDRIRY